MKRKRVELVIIEWVDSTQPRAAWNYLSDFKKETVTKCASVGFLLQNDREVKVLSQSLGGIEDDSGASVQSMGVMVIPSKCVIGIRPLVERRQKSVGRNAKATRR